MNFKTIVINETVKIPQPKQYDQNQNPYQPEDKDEEIEYNIKVPTRPLIDINSTRLVNNRIADTILTPQVDDADADRIRNIQDLQTSLNNIMNAVIPKIDAQQPVIDLAEELKIKTQRQTFQQFYQQINNFQPKFNNNWRDTLCLLTDVIYYLTNEDLYDAARNLNEGTVFMGLLHIPKYLDTDEHLIMFPTEKDKHIEGKVRIIPNKIKINQQYYAASECRMLMETDGNEHTYNHPVRFIELRTQKFLPLKSNRVEDFLLKMIVTHRVDTGATYYTSFKIVKITNPSVTDYLSIEHFTEDTAQYEYFQNTVEKVHSYAALVHENNVKEINRILKITEPKITNSIYSKYIVNMEEKLKTGRETYTQIKYENTKTAHIIPGSGKIEYYVVKRKDGGAIDTRLLFKQTLDAIKEVYKIKPLKESLINKVNTV